MEGKVDTNWTILVGRIAGLATFVVPLVLSGMLLAVKAANASPAAGAIVPLALEEEFELEEAGELEEESCEEAEGEFEEGELSETEVEEICEEAEEEEGRQRAGSSRTAPEECLLRTARSRVVAYVSRNRVRLTVGYTTYEPTAATIDLNLLGGRGALHVDTAKRHLGRSGVLRLTKNLSDSQMSKVEAAGRFIVRLHSSEAPGSCRPFETEQLTVRHGSKRLAVWSQPA